MPHRKPGRSIIPQHAGQEVTVLEAIVGPPEERDLPAQFPLRGIRQDAGGAGAVVEQRIGDITHAVRPQRPGVELAKFVTTHHIEAVDIAELPAQCQQRLERDRGVVAIRHVRVSVGRGPHRICLREVDVPRRVGAVDADVDLRREARHQIQLRRRVAQRASRRPEIRDLLGERHRVAYRAFPDW